MLLKTKDESSVLSLIIMGVQEDVRVRVAGDINDFSFLVLKGICISRKPDFQIFAINRNGQLNLTHHNSGQVMKVKIADIRPRRDVTFHITHSENLTAIRNELLGVTW